MDLIEKFNRFLKESEWNRELLEIITNYVDKEKHTLIDIDELIMSTTKKVESRLRDVISQFTGSVVPEKESYGMRLLNYAVKSGLIRSRDEPIYHLLSWLFLSPRNTSHHQFTEFPLSTLIAFMTESNLALNEVDSLFKIPRPYMARFNMSYDTKTEKIKFENVNVFRPNGTPVPFTEKVEAHVKFSDGRIKTVLLQPKAPDQWMGEYDARGEPYGSFGGYIGGVNKKIPFAATSGSICVRTFPAGNNCPHCGFSIPYDSTYCSNCHRKF